MNKNVQGDFQICISVPLTILYIKMCLRRKFFKVSSAIFLHFAWKAKTMLTVILSHYHETTGMPCEEIPLLNYWILHAFECDSL